MATPFSVQDGRKVRNHEPCPHCYGGWVFEPTEDSLEDAASPCHKCEKGQRIKAGRR